MKFAEFIENKQEIKLAFIGGSITFSQGADMPDELRYPTHLTACLNRRYEDKHFTEINAGVGGTPSAFGMFRLKNEVLDHDPDMLFIEFAVNDSGWNRYNNGRMHKYIENIIRNARKTKPDMPIMMLFAHAAYEETLEEYKKLADYYSLPYCELYKDLQELIDIYGDKKFFTDGVHPFNEGHARYVDSLMRDLYRADFTFELPSELRYGVEYNEPRMLLAETLEHDSNWTLSSRTLWHTPYKYLCGDKAGATLTVEFEGATCGVYGRIEKDGGIMEAKVDGKVVNKVHQCNQASIGGYEYNAFELITEELEHGKHTLELTVLEEKNEGSEGHVCRIGAILVG